MADVAAIRAGLIANLEPLRDLVLPLETWQLSEYLLASPTPPTVMIDRGPIEYDKTFTGPGETFGDLSRGHDDWTFTVIVIVGYSDDIGAQKQLDEMVKSHGETSVKVLLESDREIGGAALDLHVTGTSEQRVYRTDPNLAYVGSEWTVAVKARGDE